MNSIDERALDYLQQGISLMKKENYEIAAEMFNKAIEIDPRYEDAYSALADAYANMEKYAEALETMKKVLLLNPDEGSYYFDLGNLYILVDDMVKAIQNYNKADEKGYRNFLMYKNLAEIYRDLKQSELVVRNYNKAIECEPLRADLRLEKAGYYILTGKFDEALETLENLQTIHPDLFDCFEMRAEIYAGLGKYKEALSIIDEAMQEFSDDVALPIVKMRILTRMNKIDDVKMLIEKVKGMDDYPAVARNVLLQEAQIASMQNDLETAAEAFRTILAGSEEFDEEVSFMLLNIYNAQEKLEDGLKLAKELSLSQNINLYSVSGKYYVPFILKKQGHTAEANKEFRKLTSVLRRITVENPHFYEAYMYRVMCHKELGEYEKALELADYIEALDDKSIDAYALKFNIYQSMGNVEKAKEMQAIVERISPGMQL